MIGVFDSGSGGLTILRALVRELPEYSYVYLGDTKNAPYGEKGTDEIIELTKQGVDSLFSKGATLVVLACNTASAVALRELQQSWMPVHHSDKKLLGIVVPTIEQVTGADWSHTSPITTPISEERLTIGVLATPITVASNAYPNEIHKRNASVQVVQQSCPGLAGAIERKDAKEISHLMSLYVGELIEKAPTMQSVLLGCTHYELVADQISQQLGGSVRLYHQPGIVAKSLKEYLRRHGEVELDKEGKRLV